MVIFFTFGFELIVLAIGLLAAAFLGFAYVASWLGAHIYLLLIYIVLKAIVNALPVSFLNFILDIVRSTTVLAYFVYFIGNGLGGDPAILFDFLFISAGVIYFSYMPLDKWGEDHPIMAQLVSIGLLLGFAYFVYALYGYRTEFYFVDMVPMLKPYIHP